MNDVEIERRILGYRDHLEDRQYLADLSAAADGPRLNDAIISLLRSADAGAVANTCLFIRDVVLLEDTGEHYSTFRNSYPDSQIVGSLEELVRAPEYTIRRQAVYTIGKTGGGSSSLPILHEAFRFFLERDPLLLPRLAFEIFWLEEEDSLGLIDDVLGSGQYLTRWAAFDVLPTSPERNGREWQLRRRVCIQLLKDANPRVRAEAVYQLAVLNRDPAAHSLSKAARRAASREIERQRPSLCFSNLEILFGNYLYHNARHDYDALELDQFVQQHAG
jgi:hypothetical protein